MILCTIGAVVRAQDRAPAGMVARLDVTQRLEYSDNPDLSRDADDDFFGRTILGFSLLSETTNQQFRLNLGTQLEQLRDDQSTIESTNHSVNLGYDRESRAANFGLAFSFRETDNNGDVTDEEFDIDSDVIDQSDGKRRTYITTVNGAFGLDAPFSGNYDLRYSEVRYTDTSDSGLDDRSTLDLSGQLRFRFDPRIVGRLTAKYIDFDTDGDGVDRETTGIGAGLRLDVTPRFTADLGLSYDNIDRRGGETGSNDGISATLELTQDMPNGTFGVSLSSDVSSNDDGRRTFMSLIREMDLSPISSLYLSAGATHSSQAGTDPLVEMRYNREQSASRFGITLAQSVTSDTDNNDRINTTLRVNYDHRITEISSLGVNFSFFDRNELGDDPNDGQRFDIGVSYRHSLTRDWGLVSGYTFRQSTSDDESDRTSNTIFVGLQRSFSWNP